MNSRIPVLDHGYVELVETWGSDEGIVRAARMSTDKGFLGWGGKCPNCPGLTQTDPHYTQCVNCGGPITAAGKGDEKLLKFLWDNKHSSPFEMAGLMVEVQAPILVFREWMRHRTQSFSEHSARYSKMFDLHYLPSASRVQAQSKKNKQGSEGELDPLIVQEFLERMDMEQKNIYANYEWALDQGIAREIARINTPVSRYSKMRASANLLNWLKFLTLRLDESAQWEIRCYAQIIRDLILEHFPRIGEIFYASLSST